uniref:Otopetrin-2 n=1 Tax=Angiostrongylus cantonensis TaxID=6313 RepID=A0A0K0D6S4_ANGCA
LAASHKKKLKINSNEAPTGSSLIAAFHIVVSSAVMYWAVRSLATGDKSGIDAGFELVLASFALVVSLVLFAGLRCESRRVIAVYIAVQVRFLSPALENIDKSKFRDIFASYRSATFHHVLYFINVSHVQYTLFIHSNSTVGGNSLIYGLLKSTD